MRPLSALALVALAGCLAEPAAPERTSPGGLDSSGVGATGFDCLSLAWGGETPEQLLQPHVPPGYDLDAPGLATAWIEAVDCRGQVDNGTLVGALRFAVVRTLVTPPAEVDDAENGTSDYYLIERFAAVRPAPPKGWDDWWVGQWQALPSSIAVADGGFHVQAADMGYTVTVEPAGTPRTTFRHDPFVTRWHWHDGAGPRAVDVAWWDLAEEGIGLAHGWNGTALYPAFPTWLAGVPAQGLGYVRHAEQLRVVPVA